MYINWFRIGTKYPGFCDFCPEVATEVSWRVSAGLRRLPVPLSLNTHPYPFCFLPLRITKLKTHPSHLAAQSLGVSFSFFLLFSALLLLFASFKSFSDNIS